MNKNKIFTRVYLSVIFISLIILVVFAILGNISRKGYFSEFVFDDELNEVEYAYRFKINYYDKVFRNSDIYGVYIDTNNFPADIISIKMDYKGSPFGRFITESNFLYEDKIENIKYTLKIKPSIYLYFLIIILSYPFYIFIKNYRKITSWISPKNIKIFLFDKNYKKYRKNALIIYFIFLVFYSAIVIVFTFLGFNSYVGRLDDFTLVSKSDLGYVYKADIKSDNFFMPNFIYELSDSTVRFDKPDYIKYGYNVKFTEIPDWPSDKNGRIYQNEDGTFTVSNATNWNTYNYPMTFSRGEKYNITLEIKRVDETPANIDVFFREVGGVMTGPFDTSDKYSTYIKTLSFYKKVSYKMLYPTFYFSTDNMVVKSIKIEYAGDKLFVKDHYVILTSPVKLINSVFNISYKLGVRSFIYVVLFILIFIFIVLKWFRNKKLLFNIICIILGVFLFSIVALFIFNNLKNAAWTFWVFGDDQVILTTLAQGQMFPFRGFDSGGRFAPLWLYHLNIVLPLGSNPIIYLSFISLIFVAMMIFLFFVFKKYSNMLISLILLFTVLTIPDLSFIYMSAIFMKTMIIFFIALFAFTYQKAIDNDNLIFYIIAAFSASIATYYEETVFGIFFIFALVQIVFNIKSCTKKQRYFLFFLIINSIFYLTIYLYLRYTNDVTVSYNKSQASMSRIDIFIYFIKNDPLFFISLLTSLIRIFFILIKKDKRLIIFDSYLLSAVAHTFSYVILSLDKIYYLSTSSILSLIAFSGYIGWLLHNLKKLDKNSNFFNTLKLTVSDKSLILKNISVILLFIVILFTSFRAYKNNIYLANDIVSGRKSTNFQTKLLVSLRSAGFNIYQYYSNINDPKSGWVYQVLNIFASVEKNNGKYIADDIVVKKIYGGDSVDLDKKNIILYHISEMPSNDILGLDNKNYIVYRDFNIFYSYMYIPKKYFDEITKIINANISNNNL